MKNGGVWLIGLAAGAVAAAGLWWSLQPTFAIPLFQRQNYRGVSLPTAAGVIVALSVIAVEAVVTVVDALGADVDPASIESRRLAVLAAVGFSLLGLLDDLAGTGESGGFAGHLRT